MSKIAPIVVYTSPFCGYCAAAKALLARKGVAFIEIDVLADPERRREMIARSGRKTVPQVFVGDIHLGGYDDLAALDSQRRLDDLLGAHSPEERD